MWSYSWTKEENEWLASAHHLDSLVSCVWFYVLVFSTITVIPARGTSLAEGPLLSPCRYMIYILMLTAYLWKESTNSFPNFSAVQTWFILLCRAPEEADSCSSSQWDICISGLFFILSIFRSPRRGTLMSLKSHYGWCSVPAKADFLWFCSGGEEMREAKSPWSKIQKDMAGHEGVLFEMHSANSFIPSWRHTLFSSDKQR